MSRISVTHYAVGGAVIAVLVFSLFEVSLDPQFALPTEIRQVDPAQEQLFNDCFERRDKNIHEQAFTMIDNPDVQREFIATQRETARQACREQYPPAWQTVYKPLRIKLLDFRYRHGESG